MINQPLWGYTKSTPSGGGFFNDRFLDPVIFLCNVYIEAIVNYDLARGILLVK